MLPGPNTLTLPLHTGVPPQYLVRRMIKLAGCISKVMIDSYGTLEFLKRLSDPLWFQAFGCALGFDWHSSGLTTVVMSVLKQSILLESHGIAIAGGKGKKSKETLKEISDICENSFNLSESVLNELSYASKMSAKIDNSALLDGYSLYHHNLVFDEDGYWCVVQQGMNIDNHTSRRYHWLSTQIKDGCFVLEPHTGLMGDTYQSNNVLNMTSRDSVENQKTCVDILKDHKNIKDLYLSIRPLISRSKDIKLNTWFKGEGSSTESMTLFQPRQNILYSMPERVNWDLVRQMHEIPPTNYENFLSIRGVGPGTVRAISLIAELIFGCKASWNDPIRFTFVFGGKDGVPHPIDRKSYDQSISFLQSAIEGAEISSEERTETLKKLAQYNSSLANFD